MKFNLRDATLTFLSVLLGDLTAKGCQFFWHTSHLETVGVCLIGSAIYAGIIGSFVDSQVMKEVNELKKQLEDYRSQLEQNAKEAIDKVKDKIEK